jgi:Thermophilic metalloprotease (M29)
LLDENASCHQALGNAISMALNDAKNISFEDYENRGINHCNGHTDFVIGSADLEIETEYHVGRRVTSILLLPLHYFSAEIIKNIGLRSSSFISAMLFKRRK